MGNITSLCNINSLNSYLSQNPEAAAVHRRLVELLEQRPYLSRKVHALNHWVVRVEQALEGRQLAEAQDFLARIETAINLDDKRLRATFDKFDLDRSGELEVAEFRHFVTYVGFGPEAVDRVLVDSDKNSDGKITLNEFEAFVGRVGGVVPMFEQRRASLATAATKETERLITGSRVRAHYRDEGKQSQTVWDARVLDVDSAQQTVKLEFCLGKLTMTQDVPRDWVEEDLDLVEALRGIGIVDDAQHYWTILLPASEQLVVKTLTPPQSAALFLVRRQATSNHNEALPKLLERCGEIGITPVQLWSTLTWVRDLAPVIIMVNLDLVGEFFDSDTHYRNQFETQKSCGLLCTETRALWERDLFGGCYDEATGFERPKYGVLDVMNDHRGVVCARQYGDSYLVLKDARLRCTFSPEDSGGICAARLAVLDQYAHVLLEYCDEELLEVARVANAAEGSQDRIGDSEKLDSYNYKEVQIHGEVDLNRHVQRLVVHSKHRVDGFNEERLRKICTDKGWEFMWMDEEKKRRCHEQRSSSGNQKALELSWSSDESIKLPELPMFKKQ